jgi:hypothetical protein
LSQRGAQELMVSIQVTERHYVNIARRARLDLKQGRVDTGVPEAPIHQAAPSSALRNVAPLQQIGDSNEVAEENLNIAPSDIAKQVIEECEKRLVA